MRLYTSQLSVLAILGSLLCLSSILCATGCIARMPAGALPPQGFAGPAAPRGQPSVAVAPPQKAPSLSGFVPTGGPAGTTVTLTGSGFSGATAVTLGAVALPRWKVLDDRTITVEIPSGAPALRFHVVTPAGDATSRDWFAVSPLIMSSSPASGPPGTLVTLTGSGFTGATEVTLGDIELTNLKVVDDNMVTGKIPAEATTDRFTLETPNGRSIGAEFTVEAAKAPVAGSAAATTAVPEAGATDPARTPGVAPAAPPSSEEVTAADTVADPA